MFNELPDESKIKQVMKYRVIKISPDMPEAQRQFYANMKSIYKLHDDGKQVDKVNKFASILASGMYIPKDKGY